MILRKDKGEMLSFDEMDLNFTFPYAKYKKVELNHQGKQNTAVKFADMLKIRHFPSSDANLGKPFRVVATTNIRGGYKVFEFCYGNQKYADSTEIVGFEDFDEQWALIRENGGITICLMLSILNVSGYLPASDWTFHFFHDWDDNEFTPSFIVKPASEYIYRKDGTTKERLVWSDNSFRELNLWLFESPTSQTSFTHLVELELMNRAGKTKATLALRAAAQVSAQVIGALQVSFITKANASNTVYGVKIKHTDIQPSVLIANLSLYTNTQTIPTDRWERVQ